MDALPESVWRFSGTKPGPRVLVRGGVHGNEVTGVMVVERLRADLESGTLVLAGGTLTLVVGNPRAVELGTRASEAHADLNRAFTARALDTAGPHGYEARRARELAPIIAASDLVVDLHATNKPSRSVCRRYGRPRLISPIHHHHGDRFRVHIHAHKFDTLMRPAPFTC